MTSSGDYQNSEQTFTVYCDETACRKDFKVYPEDIRQVVRRGLEATVTVDLTPAAGKEPVRPCGRNDCVMPFASNTTSYPSAIAWLEEHVPADRIDTVDESVVVLRRR